MRIGKISENILKRSVINTIKYKNHDYILTGAKPSGDASVTVYGTVISSGTAGLMFDENMLMFDIKRALISAINNVAVAGGSPLAVNIEMTLPRKSQEQNIKEYMRYISALCQEFELEIAGGNTEVSVNVLVPVITFTVYGESEKIKNSNYNADENSVKDIIMVGDIALSGTAAIVKLKRDELEKRFQRSYIELAEKTEDDMNISKAALIVAKENNVIMHDLSRGGLHSAVWELSERIGKGIEVYLNSIPIRQETIEMCEQFTLNPYKMLSNGSFLIACENGEVLRERLNKEGINAYIVGKVRDDNEKVILKNEEKRYIEPPKDDQIYELVKYTKI